MKKIFLFALVILLAMVLPAMAAWTIVITESSLSVGDKVVIQVELTSDESGGSFNIFDATKYVSTSVFKQIQSAIHGKYLRRIVTTPGSGDDAPADVYTVTITDGLDTATLSDRSASATEAANGDSTTTAGEYIIAYNPLTVAVETLGDANKTTLLLEFSE